MADVSAARTKAVFEFKSATLPLIAVILKTSDLDVLAEALDAQLADSPDFFEQEPVVIDLSLLQEAQGEGGEAAGDIDFAALRSLLARHQTQPIAVRGGNAAQHAAARAAGLSVAAMPSAPAPRPPVPPAEPAPSEAPQIVREVPVPANGTLLIDKPLRSGQQVYARGGDVVVTAVVSFGAEVIADGNVHVYAPLRGKAIAGARGNTEARIFSTCMEAQLVAIAGIYRTNEVALPDSVLGKSAQVRLDGKKIAIDPIP
ncbi:MULTISPECIES: septum site-determining protein MinC [Variovorax]|jgi:septum site-determining protein MinC|uniref:septum site-determining protein MinC n=1 Tax=Variovorax TaxID=34072 RepID=UPI00086BD6DC|nr:MULTISPECIES: septum site-determining protein MinC [Variovorax]MBN8755323.1 septum site-determining protein MinC [Variovorax sp.]ODU15930.1 MAG: septum site-determining protein MinC [Variovorax sp. SCN 67-85]ODV21311.1 MAG: septum site-determining protein MinC [Variovorax sp. SCN 67-20]OJZ14126.1 MAG: septum site-determining protein MinC [Variovorax sp. 67-131]UKI08477.1 septum site-determining protein MinC [Variovorax paradoxus]